MTNPTDPTPEIRPETNLSLSLPGEQPQPQGQMPAEPETGAESVGAVLGYVAPREAGYCPGPFVVDTCAAPDTCGMCAPVEEPQTPICTRCEGCGELANSDSREPWTFWASLPSESSLAVYTGLVWPIPCDACNGTGHVRGEPAGSGVGRNAGKPHGQVSPKRETDAGGVLHAVVADALNPIRNEETTQP